MYALSPGWSLPSRPRWFYHPNKIWCSVHVMKLLIMQFSPASRHFLCLKSKYSPSTLSLNILFGWETKFHTHTRQHIKLYSSVCFNCSLETGRHVVMCSYSVYMNNDTYCPSIRHSVQTGSGAHPVSYPMGTGGSFPGVRAAGAWSWNSSSSAEVKNAWSYAYTSSYVFTAWW